MAAIMLDHIEADNRKGREPPSQHRNTPKACAQPPKHRNEPEGISGKGGQIGRKGADVAITERWLAPNLGYEPG